ncbi:DUF2784 family protein [Thermodesulfobacteriota bacterium]
MKRITNLLNVLLHILHIAIIVFSLFGWIFEPTRKANLYLLLLVLFSWFGLGLFFGFGYCLVTDIQWKIMGRLGRKPESGSYIKYLADRITGLNLNEAIMEKTTAALFFTLLTVSSFFNVLQS